MVTTIDRGAGRVVAAGVMLATLLLTGLPPSAAEAVTPCSRGTIALTFDDGPHPTHTPRVLDVLQRKRVRATFFQVGTRINAYPALTRRAHGEGHRIANHTWGHERLTSLSNDGIRSTLRRTNRRVTDLGLPAPTLVRPPYGATNARVHSVIQGLGMQQRLWTVDPQDWRSGRSADAITRGVLRNLHNGAVVLLHDGVANSPATIAALPRIVDGARARGYCIGTLNAAGRVRPPVPTVRLQGQDVVEGAKGTTTDAFVTVRLSEPTSREVSVAYRTVDDTATAGEDYRPASGRLRFGVGQTTRRVKVRIRGDDIDEPNEKVRVVFSEPAGLRLPAKPNARIKILDDDPPPSVRVDDATVAEGGPGERTVVAVPVRLSSRSGKTITVGFSTIDGSAVAGRDYVATAGTLTFPPGQRRAEVLVTVLGDDLVEGDESFRVELRDPRRVTIGRGTALVTILDDDVAAAAQQDEAQHDEAQQDEAQHDTAQHDTAQPGRVPGDAPPDGGLQDEGQAPSGTG